MNLHRAELWREHVAGRADKHPSLALRASVPPSAASRAAPRSYRRVSASPGLRVLFPATRHPPLATRFQHPSLALRASVPPSAASRAAPRSYRRVSASPRLRVVLHALALALMWCSAVKAGELPAAQAEIQITSPAGGESWSAGSQHYVTWTSRGLPSDRAVRIAYSVDDGATWKRIVRSTPDAGAFLWRVPDTVSDNCLVRISARDSGPVARSPNTFAIGPSTEVTDYEWSLVANPAEFAPRDGAGALTFDGRMWLLGGWNPRDKEHFPRICNNEVWSSTDGATWSLVKPNTFLDADFDTSRDWEGRHTAGYVVFNDRMWIVGGDTNQKHYQLDVWNSTDGKSWRHVNSGHDVPWGPRALHYTLVHDDKIWVLGGQTMPAFAPSDEAFFADVWNTSDGIDWHMIDPRQPAWSARGMIGGSAVFKDRMWILGGGTYDTPTTPERRFYNDVWSSADGENWKEHTRMAPWEARQYHDVAVYDDRLWVLEGYHKTNLNDVWYSSDGVNWYELPQTPWKPRHAAGVFVFDGALWMVAGNNMESDVWKLVKRVAGGGR